MKRARQVVLLLIFLPLLALRSSPLHAAPLEVIDGEYKLAAYVEPLVTSDVEIELWAHVWRPAMGGPYPLVVFLHGNHGTCGRFDPKHGIRIDDRIDYTYKGTCPSGYVVTPNHRGYDYLARPLAGYGYVVVSINANRGINAAGEAPGDSGLNLRRGRLVLRHLQQLAQWNTIGGAPKSLGFQLTGLMDFSQVGLMGHSRGGEGMRAAVAQYHDPDSPWPARIGRVGFRSLFEIGPVDGQTSRILNADNLYWNVLLPACDGDVFNLRGIKPFDRMLHNTGEAGSFHKSTFQVFGANHNFYNTEWQESDARSCVGQTQLFPPFVGSPEQRDTALHTLIPFFRSNTGSRPNPKLARRFDPSTRLPSSLAVVTDYARGYTPTPRISNHFVFDNFDKPTGTSTRGLRNQSSGLSHYEHGPAGTNQDASQRAASIQWKKPGGFLQVNAAGAGQAVDVSGYKALEFRVMLRCFGTLCEDPPDPEGDLDFSIALVGRGLDMSQPTRLKSRAGVRRPTGAVSIYSKQPIHNELFQTVRIPLSAFTGIDATKLRGVRFVFDRTPTSSICLANVRLTRTPAADTVLAAARTMEMRTEAPRTVQTEDQASEEPERNAIVAIRPAESAEKSRSSESDGTVEIEVTSTRLFPVTDALPAMIIGNRTFTSSHYPSGATDRLVFTLAASEFLESEEGADVSVRIGGRRPWRFGPLHKGLAQ